MKLLTKQLNLTISISLNVHLFRLKVQKQGRQMASLGPIPFKVNLVLDKSSNQLSSCSKTMCCLRSGWWCAVLGTGEQRSPPTPVWGLAAAHWGCPHAKAADHRTLGCFLQPVDHSKGTYPPAVNKQILVRFLIIMCLECFVFLCLLTEALFNRFWWDQFGLWKILDKPHFIGFFRNFQD